MMKPQRKLFLLMRAHPSLPIVPIVNRKVCGDCNAWFLGFLDKVKVGEYALYLDKWYEDREEFKDDYLDNNNWLCEQFHYNPRINRLTVESGEYTQEQFDENRENEKRLDEHLDYVVERMFKKAILVYINSYIYKFRERRK